MKIRVYDMRTRETIFTGSVKKTETIGSVLKRIGKIDFTDMRKSFITKSGRAYNYFQIAFEVI